MDSSVKVVFGAALLFKLLTQIYLKVTEIGFDKNLHLRLRGTSYTST